MMMRLEKYLKYGAMMEVDDGVRMEKHCSAGLTFLAEALHATVSLRPPGHGYGAKPLLSLLLALLMVIIQKKCACQCASVRSCLGEWYSSIQHKNEPKEYT